MRSIAHFPSRIQMVLAVALMIAIGLGSCSRGSYSEKMETINLATVPTAASALIYIAQDQNFFAANRISINIRDYHTGVATTEALLKDEVDIAWVAEFPFVHRVFAKEKISVFAVVGRFNEQYLFGRKDRRINAVADLKGKRIGMPRNTIAEFYLGRFLELNGMNIQDVFLVDVSPPQSMAAIKGESLDGVIAWEPYSSQLRVQLGDRAVVLSIQNNQPGYGAITAKNGWISGHREVVNRFLKSLAQAENYLTHNPAAAMAIVRKWLKFDEAFTETIWSENQFSLSLDQSLVTAMEDEARWMIKNNLTKEKQVPDFLNYIYVDGLKAVKPEAVNIIQ